MTVPSDRSHAARTSLFYTAPTSSRSENWVYARSASCESGLLTTRQKRTPGDAAPAKSRLRRELSDCDDGTSHSERSVQGQTRTSASLLLNVRFAPESGHSEASGQCLLVPLAVMNLPCETSVRAPPQREGQPLVRPSLPASPANGHPTTTLGEVAGCPSTGRSWPPVSHTTDVPSTSSITLTFVAAQLPLDGADALFLAGVSNCAWLSGDRENRKRGYVSKAPGRHPESREFK